MSQTFPAALTQLGISPADLPHNQTESDLLRKLLADNFFYNKVLFTMLEEYASRAAAKLHPLEAEKLRSRLVGERAPASHTVHWSVNAPLLGVRYFIRASCATCLASSIVDADPKYVSADLAQCGKPRAFRNP